MRTVYLVAIAAVPVLGVIVYAMANRPVATSLAPAEGCLCAGDDHIDMLCPDNTSVVVKRCDGCQYVYTGASCDTGCMDGQTISMVCADGTQVPTQVCDMNQWVATGSECPQAMCKDGDEISAPCIGGEYVTRSQCVSGQWVLTGDSCTEDVQSV